MTKTETAAEYIHIEEQVGTPIGTNTVGKIHARRLSKTCGHIERRKGADKKPE